MSNQLNFEGTLNVISSPASASGALPCDSQAGQTAAGSGPAVAPVRDCPSLESAAASATIGIYGPSGLDLSPNVADSTDFQKCFSSKLRQRMAEHGSLEYVVRFKQWAIGSGPEIFAARASGRQTSGK